MPRTSKLLVGLLLSIALKGAIAFVSASSGGCSSTSTGTSTCSSATITIAANNTIVIIYAIRTATSTGTAPTDPAGNTYTQVSNCTRNNTVRVECWTTAAGASKALSTQAITCNLSAGSKFVCSFAAYSGVVALGTATSGTASAASPTSPTYTTQDTNDWCVGGFSGEGTGTFTASSGNLRNSAATATGSTSTNIGGALMDNTTASSGASCTTKVTNTDTVWALASLGLRSTLPAITPMKLLMGVGLR